MKRRMGDITDTVTGPKLKLKTKVEASIYDLTVDTTGDTRLLPLVPGKSCPSSLSLPFIIQITIVIVKQC